MRNKKLTWIPCVAGLISTGACAAQGEDDGIRDVAMASEMMDVGIAPLIAGDTGLWDGSGQFAQLAAQCDPQAELSMIDACGKSVLGDAHFAWTDCEVSLPESSPKAEVKSSGTLSLSSDFSGHCETDDFSVERTARIEVFRELRDGVSMHIFGTATSKSTQSNPSEMEIDIFRNIVRDDTIVATANITALFSIRFEQESRRRTLSGTAIMTMQHPRIGTRQVHLQLDEVVRASHEECRWPIGGTITTSTGDTERRLSFGPGCGDATRNGEAVKLDDMKEMGGLGGPRGRHGGRPF